MLMTITETIDVQLKPGKPSRFHAGELADLPDEVAHQLAGRGLALYVPFASHETIARDAAIAAARVGKTARVRAKKEPHHG